MRLVRWVFDVDWFVWVGHDSLISNGRLIYSIESLITLKQPSTNKRGRHIHLFFISGINVYNPDSGKAYTLET